MWVADHPAQLHQLVPLPEEVHALLRRYDGERHGPPADPLIAAFTGAQEGVVARRQLLEAHLNSDRVDNRVRRRQLVARFRGVYAPGHLRLTLHGHRTAVVLAVRGTVLTHVSATALHGVSGNADTWHVTAPESTGRRSARSSSIVVHVSATLGPEDLCVVDGVPCTTLERSIVDAADIVSARQLANILARAERACVLHLAAVRGALERTGPRPTRGRAALTAALNEHLRLGAQLSRSEVGFALREVAVRAGLPAPMLNRVVAGDEVDALWPAARIGVEIDSWAFHRDRRAFVADRAKLRRLFLRGFVVLPYAAADVRFRPDLVADELRAALNRSRTPVERPAGPPAI